MIEAQRMTPEDLVYIGDLLWGYAGRDKDGDVILSHTCATGEVTPKFVNPWDTFLSAGERLMDLRGELDDIEDRLQIALRKTRRLNQVRREIALGSVRDLRAKRASVEAQIAELEDLGIKASMTLGDQSEPCRQCKGSGTQDNEICGRCAGQRTEL